MVKLKIGKAVSKPTAKKQKDPLESYSDEELEELEEEINGNEEIDMENLRVEHFNFNQDLLELFREKYPDKNIIYHNELTKQFFEFYLDNAHSLGQLEQINYNLLSDEFKEMYSDLITEIEMEKAIEQTNGNEEKMTDEILEKETNIVIDLKTDKQREKYEFILDSKWEKREKGIQALDDIIREVFRTSTIETLDEVLNYLLEKFDLVVKWNKRDVKVEIEEKPKEKPKKKLMKSSDIQKGIKYFKYVEFLYNLLSDERVKVDGDFTKEEIEIITEIDGLVNRK